MDNTEFQRKMLESRIRSSIEKFHAECGGLDIDINITSCYPDGKELDLDVEVVINN